MERDPIEQWEDFLRSAGRQTPTAEQLAATANSAGIGELEALTSIERQLLWVAVLAFRLGIELQGSDQSALEPDPEATLLAVQGRTYAQGVADGLSVSRVPDGDKTWREIIEALAQASL